MISSYLRDCNHNLALLRKDDNYIFYYVGYHLANAKLFHYFEVWYFDLEFIEGKLKVAGPADLLLDYKRYQTHFTDGFVSIFLSFHLIRDVRLAHPFLQTLSCYSSPLTPLCWILLRCSMFNIKYNINNVLTMCIFLYIQGILRGISHSWGHINLPEKSLVFISIQRGRWWLLHF